MTAPTPQALSARTAPGSSTLTPQGMSARTAHAGERRAPEGPSASAGTPRSPFMFASIA
ncbi:hypothetical protein [Streptomyces sp. NPDC007905]|uniref:hypothetical protein n=1 Tax=Streptomyces sp. NPDC007905 TaxID=3364788 RepID=UPI0036E5C083